MKRFLFRSVLALGLVAGCLLGVSRLAAQEAPSAEAILDKADEAVGGKEINQKVKTVVMKGKISVGDMQLQFAMYHAGTNKHYKEFTLEGLGQEETIINGDMAWKKDSVTGTRVLKGEEKSKAFADVETFHQVFHGVGNWRQITKQARLVGEEKVEGKAAYKIHLTPLVGTALIHLYYDKETGLLLRREVSVDTPQGKVTSNEYHSDHKKFDGIMHACTTRIVGGPAEVVVTIDYLEHNVAIPEDRFAVPADVKKLVEQQK